MIEYTVKIRDDGEILYPKIEVNGEPLIDKIQNGLIDPQQIGNVILNHYMKNGYKK